MKSTMFIALLLIVFLSAHAQQAIPIGSKAPVFKALTAQGKTIDLSEVSKQKQVVLMFYRGQWCPYCNKQMSELEDSLQYIHDLGAMVIAITPEKPTEIAKMVEKSGASFDIIYDQNHKIMDRYNVTFSLSEEVNAKYKGWGIDINKASGNDDYALPVPATYIIDKNGTIKGAFFNEDYKKRMYVAHILKVLKQ
ncbi:Peroxiredoxin [Saccharicrinis carchari]|uniref:thioredoxin-dependent peroxiredoxin n=1 Tax=Saccharicrinis carchari TaxID=1168039 RepID=A0A521C1U8_SACCC|nr:peroxiredoxin-like family protein [Saccharicrinis carchari]SMO53432.1 Peroxiredoxin [Saccharicrinis carchari]